ncbi:CDGSH iron-sulfur domain-containing protein [Brevibacillus fulvus]|uniref:CDGSH-type Zn-finger protein n=1 Tax=Brevibacillus fulvus TaxID=1125967 RepID=A0A938XRP6_9BACL|nr:CDGSH iron-sulfur domain-containing protein [Brevibacillus fulvus]MBM7589043.1 CDGSH-type Zn-finger protein [Brevibacillus fulvus]
MGLYDKNKPYVIKEEPGLKMYCACGLTEEPPYCDGSHNGKNTGKRPYLVKIEHEQVVSICGCGRSAKLPFCDNAHLREDRMDE